MTCQERYVHSLPRTYLQYTKMLKRLSISRMLKLLLDFGSTNFEDLYYRRERIYLSDDGERPRDDCASILKREEKKSSDYKYRRSVKI